MTKDQLNSAIDLIYDSNLHERSMQLFNWLHPGKMKNTVQDLFDLINYQKDLIALLEKETIDKRIEHDGRKPVFYPMSYTPRKRY